MSAGGTGTGGRGEDRTFEEKVGATLDVLFDGALLLTKEPERAESLVLSAVTDAARRAGAPADEPEFRRWLCGRLVRQYLGYVGEKEEGERRGARGAAGGPVGSPAASFSADEGAIDQLLGRLEVLERHAPERLGALIRRELARLPLHARAALWLVDVLGATYAQAAADLAISRSLLRGHLFAGRRELQARLAVALREEVRPRAAESGRERG